MSKSKVYILFWLLILLIYMGCKNNKGKNPRPLSNIIYTNYAIQAARFEKEGKIDSAAYYYKKHWQQSISQNKIKAATHALLKLAMLEKERKRSREMNRYLNLADSLQRKYFPEHDSLRAEILHLMAIASLISQNPEKAISYLNTSKYLKTKLYGNNDTILANTYNNLGICYYLLADFEKAKENYLLAINLARRMRQNPNPIIAKASENLAMIYTMQGNYDQAISYFSEGLRLKSMIYGINSVETARAYLNIANFYITLSNYEEAQANLLRAENVFINSFGPAYKDLADVYLNLGRIYVARSDYEKALMYFNKSADILQPPNIDSTTLRLIRANIGYIYFVRNNYPKAIQYLSEGFSSQKNRPEDIKVYRNLARCYQSLGRRDTADYLFRKSIQLSEGKTGNPYELATSLLYYGEFFFRNKEYDKARKNYLEAYKIFNRLFGQNNRDRAYAILKLGEILLAEGKEKEALQTLQDAVVAMIPLYKSRNPFDLPSTLPQVPEYYLPSAMYSKATALFRLWEKTGDTAYLMNSGRHYRACITLTDRIRSLYTSDESIIQLSQNIRKYIEDAMKASIAIFKYTGDEKYLAEAFDYSDRSKSALLLLAFRDLDEIAMGEVPREVLDEEKSLRNRIMGYKKLIYDQEISGKPNSAKIALWNAEIFKLERLLEAHLEQIRKNYPAYYARKYEGKGIDIGSLQNALTPDESIIEYTFTDSTLYVFILNHQGLKIMRQRPKPSLYTAVPKFLTAIQSGLTIDASSQFQTFTRHASLFYDVLIKPYRNFLKCHKLIVIPEGILSHLPFEAFLSQKVEGKIPEYRNLPYLMNNYCIRYAYVATNLLIPEKKNVKNNKVAAFAPVVFKPNSHAHGQMKLYPDSLPELPYSLEETRKVVRMTGGDLFERENASEASFKKMSSDYKIIHLATHTWIDTLNPFFSKFVMYNQPDSIEDNLISMYEITNLNLQSSLVVLNSCNSGIGNTMSGEGVFNLARGFFYAGVPAVMATLWEVDDNIGSDIVQRFYKKLMKGVPADEALWESRKEYLQQSDRLKAHPYFWSPYAFIGQSKVIEIKNPARWYRLMLLATGIITLAGLLLGIMRYNRKRINRAV